MCGRFKLSAQPSELYAEFGIVDLPVDYTARYNIAPSQPVLSITAAPDGWQVVQLRWGLIPYWSQEPKGGSQRINARAETLVEKPAFRDAFQRRRCLVLADGFYEWGPVEGRRQPVLIRRRDGRPFAFAGIWERWGPRDQPLLTCAIVTTTPNALLARVHNRMPVILGRLQQEAWLDPHASPESLQSLLQPCAEDELEMYVVSPLVNSPANDVAECALPL
jgi:putative SOS response-associated peptidase YedK